MAAKIACLFPGQGAQSVGMGQDLFNNSPEAKAIFEQADRIADRKLSQLCFEGPESELKRTINTQPTILTVSIAAWQAYLAANGPLPQYVAGHSLGEFTALYAGQVLSLENVVKLVGKRAELMENCPKGAMTAVLGVPAEKLVDICETVSKSTDGSSVVIVANFNTRDQLVLSGNPQAVDQAAQLAKDAGGKAIPLPVGGAFHSPLMTSAAKQFAQELDCANFSDSKIKVVQNFDALAATDAAELKGKLKKQMESSVRWYPTIEFMLADGVSTFIEIGPGKALAGMIKKIDRQAKVFNVFDTESLKATIAELASGAVAVS